MVRSRPMELTQVYLTLHPGLRQGSEGQLHAQKMHEKMDE